MVKKDGEAAEKEAYEIAAFDDPLASTNREEQEREKKQKTEGHYGEKAAEKEALEREEALAQMRYENAVKKASDSFRAWAAATETKKVFGSEIGELKQFDENEPPALCSIEAAKVALFKVKCNDSGFRRISREYKLARKKSQALALESSEKDATATLQQ